MSITLRPNQPYIEYEIDNYKIVDQLINKSYTTDLDIDVYEGNLIDNYICYQPNSHALRELKEETDFSYKTIHQSAAQTNLKFDYLVVLETFATTQSSTHRLIYTNDEDWVEQIRTILQEDDD